MSIDKLINYFFHIKLNFQGCTRTVIEFDRYVVKIPKLHGPPTSKGRFYDFIRGLIANMREKHLSRSAFVSKWYPELPFCPVIFSMWGGFLNIMPKCVPITRSQWDIIDVSGYDLFCEIKLNSFGWYNDKVVAMDYAS